MVISEELASRGFITEAQAAKFLGVALGTLRAWRVQGKGPRHYKIAKSVYFRESDIEQFIEQQARTSSHDQHQQAA